jgi:hypothetical protein
MSDDLTVLCSETEINVINDTGRPVLLLSVESPDVPEWIEPTGLEHEAQYLNHRESWTVPITVTLGSEFFHVEVVWLDENEKRRSRKVRLRP